MGKKGEVKEKRRDSQGSSLSKESTTKKDSVVGEAAKRSSLQRGSASAEPGASGEDPQDAEDASKDHSGAGSPESKAAKRGSTSPQQPSRNFKAQRFVKDGPPPIVVEDAKLRLARTMDRFSYLNHTRKGLSELIAQQNRQVRFIVEHNGDVAPLATALRRTTSEAEQLVDKESKKQQASGVLSQRLKIIDAYVAADHRRKARVYDTIVEATVNPDARKGFAATLPTYSHVMNRPFLDPGQERPHPLMAVTCVTAPRYLVPKIPRSGSEPRKLMSQTM